MNIKMKIGNGNRNQCFAQGHTAIFLHFRSLCFDLSELSQNKQFTGKFSAKYLFSLQLS